MRRNERFIEVAKYCMNDEGCDKCPYNGKADCINLLLADAIERLEKQSVPLEQPTVMPDYEAISHKLGEELERVEIENERIQSELSEAQKELAYLRAVKATTEAFLGVKI